VLLGKRQTAARYPIVNVGWPTRYPADVDIAGDAPPVTCLSVSSVSSIELVVLDKPCITENGNPPYRNRVLVRWTSSVRMAWLFAECERREYR
jgi:hypothetical protein